MKSNYDRKTAARRFRTTHKILRSLGLAQSFLKGENAPIWRCRNREVNFFHFWQNVYRPEFVFSVLLGPLRHFAHDAVHQRTEMFPDFVSHFHMAGVDQLCPQSDYLLLKLRGWRNLYEANFF